MNDLGFLARVFPPTWTIDHLADVTSKIGSGATPRGGSTVYIDEGPAFIRSQNVYDNEFRSDGLAHLTEDAADQLRGVTVEPNDVLINITGDSILRTCLVPGYVLPARVSQHVAIVRSNGRVVPGFLQKWLSLPAMKDFMLGHSAGGTRKAITKGHLLSFPLPLPPIEEQQAIATTLGALDDKIESNRRSVRLIEKLLVLEFQKLLCKEPVEYRRLSDLATITKGVSYKSVDLQTSTTSLVTLKSFDRKGGYKVDGLKQYTGPYKPQQVIQPGEVVVAQTDLTQGAEVVGRAVRVPADSSADVLVASLDLAIVRPTSAITREYLLGLLVDEAFREHCRSRTSGTTVLHLAGDAIPSYMAPIASASSQESFSTLSRPLLAKADSLNAETVGLAKLRDALMPELLSGRIRVPEAKEATA